MSGNHVNLNADHYMMFRSSVYTIFICNINIYCILYIASFASQKGLEGNNNTLAIPISSPPQSDNCYTVILTLQNNEPIEITEKPTALTSITRQMHAGAQNIDCI